MIEPALDSGNTAWLLAASALVLLEVHRPKVEEVPTVPPEEQARPWRAAAAAPRLQPEKGFRAGLRDPFHVEDPWVEAPPTTLALPPGTGWRAGHRLRSRTWRASG